MQTFKLIESDTVHLIQPILVEHFGRIQAEFLSQLNYWIKNDKGISVEGRTWIFNTYEGWANQLRISKRHMIRIIKNLVEKGAINVEKLSKHKSNRTNYYSINYIELEKLVDFSHCDKKSQSSCHEVTMVIQRITNKDINNKSEEIRDKVIENKNFDKQVHNLKNIYEKEEGKGASSVFEQSLQVEASLKNKNTSVQDMLAYWNNTFPKSRAKLSKDLGKNLIGAFIHRFEKNMEKWQHYCTKISSSAYLMGEEFVLTLSWALKFWTIDRVLNNDLGVKDIQFVPSIQTLETQATKHIDGVMESELCKQTRHLLLKKLGAATYVSWFTMVQLLESEKGRVFFKADNLFVEDYITQKFGSILC